MKTEGAKQIITPPPPPAPHCYCEFLLHVRVLIYFLKDIRTHYSYSKGRLLCLPVHPTQIKKRVLVKTLFFKYPTLILIKNKIIQSNNHSENYHAYFSGWSQQFENLNYKLFMRWNIFHIVSVGRTLCQRGSELQQAEIFFFVAHCYKICQHSAKDMSVHQELLRNTNTCNKNFTSRKLPKHVVHINQRCESAFCGT